jgi:hypothetical protein
MEQIISILFPGLMVARQRSKAKILLFHWVLFHRETTSALSARPCLLGHMIGVSP